MAGRHAAGAKPNLGPKGRTPTHAKPKGGAHAKPKGPNPLNNTDAAGAKVKAGASAVSKPVTAGASWAFSAKHTTSFGKSAIKSTGKALPFLLAATFLIVALAKIRGGDKMSLDIPRAFFGGLILAFFLSMVALWSKELATMFAGLVLIGVTIELGPTAFGGGLFTGKTTPLTDTLFTSDGTPYSPNGLAPLAKNAKPENQVGQAPEIIALPGGGQVQVPAGTGQQWLKDNGYA